LQLYESVSHGYFEARSLTYLQGARNALLEWLRLPGDAVFIVGGVLPLIYLSWLSLRLMVPPTSEKKAEVALFTEVSEMAERQP
jgi:nitric oxide reductase subunit B